MKSPTCVLLCCCLVLAAGCQSSPAPDSDHPRLILIGLDGATWDVMGPLMADGHLPNLGRLHDTGAHGRLASMKPTISPGLWTTIATGKTPEKHGVWGFRYLDENEVAQPINSTIRRARTFWEILGDHGRTSCIIGWWNTWPATPMSGVLVSDYLFFSRNAIQADRPRELGEILDHATYPATLTPFVAKVLEEAEAIPAEYLRSVVPYDEAGLDEFRTSVDARLGGRRGDALSVLKNKLIEARFHLEVGRQLMQRTRFDLTVYYSKGIDATGHKFWEFYEPDAEPYAKKTPTEEELLLYADVVPNFYLLEDRQVGRMLEQAGPDTYVLVVSDHGHHAGGHNDAPDGIFLLSGPGVRANASLEGIGLPDITPLILYLFDLPVGEDMDGYVPSSAFTKEHQRQHPVRFVRTHEKPRDVESVELDDEVRAALEAELRSLGYID